MNRKKETHLFVSSGGLKEEEMKKAESTLRREKNPDNERPGYVF